MTNSYLKVIHKQRNLHLTVHQKARRRVAQAQTRIIKKAPLSMKLPNKDRLEGLDKVMSTLTIMDMVVIAH